MQVRSHPGAKNHTEAFARFHRVACDKPFDDEGSGTGMTPEELMLCALGSSAMQCAVAYLRSRGISVDGIELRVSAELSGQGSARSRLKGSTRPDKAQAGSRAPLHRSFLHRIKRWSIRAGEAREADRGN